MNAIASRAQELLGATVMATNPVAGGDICTATRIRLSDGRSALAKTRRRTPPDFFQSEARGLQWLAEVADGPPVPEVLAVADDCLILSWVENGRPSTEGAEEFARALAVMHQAGADSFGADADGFIGTVPLSNTPTDSWPEFWATRRVLPYLKVARDRGAISADDAQAVENVMDKVDSFAGPPEPPRRIHGDLWAGNVLWDGGGTGWLVDAGSAHGGHRETDLAMLALFGAPNLSRILEVYDEAAPLAEGWRERVPLHQMHPLLVHAILFGGSYGERVGAAARLLL